MSDFARLQELARDAGLQPDRPVNTAVPAVMPQTANVGDALTCTMGEWTGEPDSYTYSWRHAGDPAEIATGDSYTTVAGDAGTSVQCVVTATNSAGSTAASASNAVAVPTAARAGVADAARRAASEQRQHQTGATGTAPPQPHAARDEHRQTGATGGPGPAEHRTEGKRS
jgi:hypothetical protein